MYCIFKWQPNNNLIISSSVLLLNGYPANSGWPFLFACISFSPDAIIVRRVGSGSRLTNLSKYDMSGFDAQPNFKNSSTIRTKDDITFFGV